MPSHVCSIYLFFSTTTHTNVPGLPRSTHTPHGKMARLDLHALAADASNLTMLLGVPSDEATKGFLDRYPLPLLFSLLEGGDYVSELIASTLEKIFKTSFIASILPQVLSYAGAGLNAASPLTRRMTCLAISKLLEDGDNADAAIKGLIREDILSPLLSAIGDWDETVAIAAAGAIKNLAKSSTGLEVLVTGIGSQAGQLKELAMHGSALVKIRVFSIVASLFGHSELAAAAVKQSGILGILEAELDDTSDILAHLNAFELLYEVALTPYGPKFLSMGNLVERLIFAIGNPAVDPIVCSRAMMIGACLISPGGSSPSPVSPVDAKRIVHIIDEHMGYMKGARSNRHETAIDALGKIGMSAYGSELLFCGSPSVASHIIEAAFTRERRDIQLLGIQALVLVAGSERDTPLLSEQAELHFQELIFTAAEKSSKKSPGDLIWCMLQEKPDTRLAVYRLIALLASRSWCLQEICSNKDLVNFLTDPHIESTKKGMECRYACCVAVDTYLTSAIYRTDPSLSEVIEKLHAAVAKGPYLAKERVEAQPLVITQERF